MTNAARIVLFLMAVWVLQGYGSTRQRVEGDFI